MTVPVKFLVHTSYILTKAKFTMPEVCMEYIIGWDKLTNIGSLSNGPGSSSLKVKMPWTSVLKVLLETTLVCMEKDPDMHFDTNVKYEKKRKSIDGTLNETRKAKKGNSMDSEKDFVPTASGSGGENQKHGDVGKVDNKTGKQIEGNKVTNKLSLKRKKTDKKNKPDQTDNTRPDKTTNAGLSQQQDTNLLRQSVIVPWPQPLPPTWAREEGYYPITPEQLVSPEKEDDSDLDNSFFDSVSPITPPTKVQIQFGRSDFLNQSEMQEQNKTPDRSSRAKPCQSPTNKCLFDWSQDSQGLTLSSFKPGCLLQMIGVNNFKRHAPCNVRISDGSHWMDVDVADNLRIYFGGEMVKEDDIIVIKKTEGTLNGENFKILAFVRPQWAQREGTRVGHPVPLVNKQITNKRGVKQGGIVPLLSSVSSMEEEDIEKLIMEEAVSSTQLSSEPPTSYSIPAGTSSCVLQGQDENPRWLFSEESTLSQMLRDDYEPNKDKIKDTPLVNLKLNKEDIRKVAISKKVYENAEHLINTDYEIEYPWFDGDNANWDIHSEFNSGEYKVKLVWPDLMPRTKRAWNKMYTPSCTCPGYLEHGPARYCKHICFILLKYFSK